MFIGEPLRWTGDKASFLDGLCQAFDKLEVAANKPAFLDEPGCAQALRQSDDL